MVSETWALIFVVAIPLFVCETESMIVYVIKFERGVKVGITTDLKRRFREMYGKPWVQPVLALKWFRAVKPREVEDAIKAKYAGATNRRSTEFFFNVSFEEVVSDVKRLCNPPPRALARDGRAEGEGRLRGGDGTPGRGFGVSIHSVRRLS